MTGTSRPATRPAPRTSEAVILDFYGTLAEAVSWGPTFAHVLESHGYPATDEAGFWRTATVDGTDHRRHSVSRDAYVAWERARLDRFARTAGVADADLGPVVDDLYRAAKTFELRPYPETLDVLERLRARGLRLAVCSNWDWDLPDLLERLNLRGFFDAIVTSARAGARKPHPHIYRHTLAALGTRPEAAVFAGDSWEPDVVGPLALGIRAVHVARRPDGGDPPLPAGAGRSDDLTGLLDLVDLLDAPG